MFIKMSQRLTINQGTKPIYDIVYENDFNKLAEELEKFDIANKKLCVITDSRVKGFYADEICELLKDKCKKVPGHRFMKTCFLVTCGCACSFLSLKDHLVTYQCPKYLPYHVQLECFSLRAFFDLFG